MADENKEAMVVINGHYLTYAESMTLRVAIASFLISMVEEGIGDDEIGISMAKNYIKNASDIQSFIMEEVPRKDELRMNISEVVVEQLAFVAWLTEQGIYNPMESSATMVKLHAVWKKAGAPKAGVS